MDREITDNENAVGLSEIGIRRKDLQTVALFGLYVSQPGRNRRNRRLHVLFGRGIRRICRIYREAILRDEIAVLSLGTRPDCLGDEIMELLQELNRIKPVWIELGLQTIHEKTALRINRGYPLPVFEEAVRKLKQAGLQVIVHVILSLPGEEREDMLETARYLSGLNPGIDGIKLQMLNILEGTAMAEEYKEHPFPLLTMEEYAEIVCEMIRILPDDIVVHRMTGDGPGNLLIAPEWVRNKKKVLNTIHRRLRDIG